jgi:hypothetical protein
MRKRVGLGEISVATIFKNLSARRGVLLRHVKISPRLGFSSGFSPSLDLYASIARI